ncbi:hypothetical protein [Kribbella sp. CA-293567]|uniref:hypothetical protein n=1 Tax=Kribbella sp. CA-293567 TaxID=3002436 RepID=UPI0022DDF840|nr:hypothetical protein [Kribbella sp. CA-293567]WBQ03281.1 hypothetical protein OX958_25285 [Kribbella sp. CA-293567]
MMLRSKLIAAGCAVVLLPLAAVKVMAADPPQHLGEGQAVGARAVADPAVQIRQATSSYYVTSYGQPDDHSPEAWEILSSANGAVVRTSPRLRDEPDKVPALVGKYVVTTAASQVGFRDIATDTVSQVDVPAGAAYQGAYPGGILLSRAADSSFALRTVDNIEKPVTGAAFGDPVILDTTATSILISVGGQLSVVDTATGAATAAATLPANPAWAALTPNRVLWQTAATANSKTVGWKQGATTGSVQVPFGLPLLTVGDDLAVLVPETKQLTKIAANGGAVTAAFVTGVHDAADLGNGRLLVSAQSKVASVGADGVLTTVKATPSFAAQVSTVGMSGARVVTADYQPEHGVYETTTNGTTWTSLTTSNATKPLQLEGTTLVTYQAGVARVRGSGGDLTFPATDDVVLGKGGKLVSHRVANAATAAVYDVATKTKIDDFPVPFALADSSLWKVTETGVLTGKDLATQATKTVAVASGCTVGPDRVNGRWALLSGCNGGNQVVDTKGPEAPRNLTVGADAQLGNGFVVQSAVGQDANGLSTKELLVTDLNDQDLGQRRYGPINGRLLQPASFRTDGGGGFKVIYADPDARPRIIDLTWVKADPQQRPDTVAPVLTSATAGDRLRDNTSLSFDWAFTDPQDPNSPATGVLSYDLRIQQRPNRTSPYGAWNQVPSWQGLKTTAASYSAVAGTDTCWQVRARDYAGNLSGWSNSYCSEVDGIAPVAFTLKIDRVQLGAAGNVRWSYTDETSVGSYDIVYKEAAAGAAFGVWTYPAAWQNTDITSINWVPRAGFDQCYMVRARDVVGNLSAWSPPLCSVTPQDDRALLSSGTVVRVADATAYQGTTSDLRANGAFLTKTAAEAGVRIALVTINGPGQGKVDVYHANIKVGTVSLAATTTARTVTYLPVTAFRTGVIKLVSTSTAQSRIDGVAFLRY